MAMLQEHKSEPKLQDEDSYSTVGTKCDSQNNSKYIDTDFYSYISDIIIQISKNITNGRGLSQAGINSLFLFILTSGLLYGNTILPQTAIEILKLYIVPLIFLFYFL